MIMRGILIVPLLAPGDYIRLHKIARAAIASVDTLLNCHLHEDLHNQLAAMREQMQDGQDRIPGSHPDREYKVPYTDKWLYKTLALQLTAEAEIQQARAQKLFDI